MEKIKLVVPDSTSIANALPSGLSRSSAANIENTVNPDRLTVLRTKHQRTDQAVKLMVGPDFDKDFMLVWGEDYAFY